MLNALRDALDDLFITLTRSPVQVLLLGMGSLVACEVAVSATALSTTEAGRVEARLMRLAPTTVQAQAVGNEPGADGIPIERVEHLRQQPGITGVAWYTSRDAVIEPVAPGVPLAPAVEGQVLTVGGDLDVLDFTARDTRAPVVNAGLWVGKDTDELGDLPVNYPVRVGQREYRITGFHGVSSRLSELGGAVAVVPPEPPRYVPDGAKILVGVAPGTASDQRSIIANTLQPGSPGRLQTVATGDIADLRQDINNSVSRLGLIIALALLVVSGIAVGVAAFARIVETRKLIALSRATGASRTMIVLGLATESAIIGLCSGLIGASLGAAGTLLYLRGGGNVSLSLVTPVVAVTLAGAVNFVGAAIPSILSTREQPARVLRAL